MPSTPWSDNDAIAAALSGNWNGAIAINLSLLRTNPSHIDALGRLAYAYLKNGELTAARRTFGKVLDLDPYNAIAIKQNQLLAGVKRKTAKKSPAPGASPGAFLEDPGKTKIVSCVNLAPAPTLTTLSPGQLVELKARNHAIELRAQDKTYLAALPDDVAFKLLKLLAAGNTYQAVVKAVGKNALTVILRELSRGRRFANQPSFISSVATTYTPFAPSEVRHEEKPSVAATGEDDLEEEKAAEEKEEEER